MATESSWNPAFRPNTAATPSKAIPSPSIEPHRTIESIIASHHDEEAYLPNYDDENATEREHQIDPVLPPQKIIENEIALPNNEGHSDELGHLQDTPTTYLGSPGGVGLEEKSTHNEEQQETEETSPVEVASSEILEKAKSPPRGPAHEPGHSSTESFSRTVSHVSQEVNWGEEDEVDPEWNLQRTENDPFKFMAPSDRTNSFPVVQPARSISPRAEEPLAQNQAESVIKGLEETMDPFFQDGAADDDFFNQDRDHHGAADSPMSPAKEEDELDTYNDYGKSYGGDLGDQDTGLRYEEGLPLVSHPDDNDNHFESSQIPEQSLFGDDGIDEDEDFFNQNGGKVEEDQPIRENGTPKLDRKSTMQVMDSLDFHPHQKTQTYQHSPTRDMGYSKSPLESGSLNNLAVTAISEEAEAQFFEKQTETFAREPSEEDLAAKWQAELGEDELLEDDDFLPDDEPEKQEPDPTSFFGSDDEGFLADPDETPLAHPEQATNSGQAVGFNHRTGISQQPQQNRYLPPTTTPNAPQQQNRAPYSPATPLFTDLSNNRPQIQSSATAPYGYGVTNNVDGPPVSFGQQSKPQRPDMSKAQSFADKAKGGYSSPYDLPMDLKPKKRPSMQYLARGSSNQAPSHVAPPRSNSMNAQYPPPSRGSASSISPPTSSHSYQQFPGQQPQIPVPPPNQTAPPTLKSKGSFFEELPMTTKPKPAGRYTPQPAASIPPSYPPSQTNLPPQGQRPPPVHAYTQPAQTLTPVYAPGQNLVAPAKVNPYASVQNGMGPQVPQVPSTTQRYSPAPPQPRNVSAPPGPPAAATSRYSPAPHQPPTAYVPRTSSPLAQFSESSRGSAGTLAPAVERRSFSHEPPLRMAPTLPAPQEIDENQEYQGQIAQSNPHQLTPETPPPMHSTRFNMPPPKRSMSNNYDPVHQVQTSPQKSFVPPPRAQTQSPGAASRGPRLESTEPYQRPGSVHSPTSSYSAGNFQSMTAPSLNVARTRPSTQSKNYIAPTDGRELDPLQRWKGCPIFTWGVGGSVITSFPVEVPRYTTGHTMPMYICSPGEVKVRNVKDVLPLQSRLASFPGPLKGKSKKKDLISWLNAGIEILEKDYGYLSSLSTLSHQDKRNEERILLWKILRVFIENDGVLEGNPAAVAAVRSILSPSLDVQSNDAEPLYATGADLSGIVPSANSRLTAEPVDPAAVDELRKHLLRGDRTKAVWEAVDKRLWAHAMLISNTVSKDLYKQVAQEFVREEVKNIGENTQSLAVLYEIFAGNFEESIDELVAPSARAGFKMVSTARADAGPSKSALDGLDRWRETLGLVLSNRSTDDSQALNALGKLLSGYGRAEAAHICFLFARSISVFGGFDDPSSSIVLVGSDHQRQPNDFAKELEPILLSEVYEYGSSLSTTSNIPGSAPHLAVYKLQHAKMLAEYGLRDKALAYCDAIMASITSQTKRSPYHHSLLLSSLEDLTKRLKASPKDESNSWISKPSIEKVSGSVWSTFNKFVAGDEHDDSTAAAGADGSTEVGPFARIAGGTPTISRSPSQPDIYGGTYNGAPSAIGGIPIPGANRAPSRYLPGASSYTPPALGQDYTSSSYGSQPRQSFEQQPRSSDELRRGPYEAARQSSEYNRPTSQAGSLSNGHLPVGQLRQPFQQPQNPYAPVVDSPYSASTSSLHQSSPYPATPNTGLAPNFYGSPQSTKSDEPVHSTGYVPPEPTNVPQASFEYETPSTNTGYEPPSSSSYEPPSYNTSYEPEPDSPVDTRPKKKSFMDDDDDGINYSAAAPAKPREKTKAEIDREVDEAFRKAAEEDAKKDAEKPVKKGWGLGGWFGGGGKKDSSQDMSQPNKPIRAKLGEESSFVYDPDLKRWINKKDKGAATERPSSTPPPPKGPARMSSGGGPPLSRPTSSASLASVQGPNSPHGPIQPSMERSISSSMDSEAPLPAGPRPELRKAESMMGLRAPPASFQRSISNGSLAGGPGAGIAAGSAPPSRPATGMSGASSLDELLGSAPMGSRRGMGAKAKKKGRYVDVFPTGATSGGGGRE